MKRETDHQNQQNSEQCNQWSATSLDCKDNLYSTLSQNLQRYERIFKCNHPSSNRPRINKSGNSRRILLPSLPLPQPQDDKQNCNGESNYLDAQLLKPCLKDSKNIPKARQYPKSSKESREDGNEGLILKQREVRFQRRDKKKFKDRFVDIYIQMKQTKGKEKMSLRQIDSINKQNKEEKIDLFLKLLKR